MEFACSVCEYTSVKKSDITRHIKKKQSCGPGIKEIIEIPTKFECEYCKKPLATFYGLLRHKKLYCKQKEKIIEAKIKEQEKKIKEQEKKIKELEKINDKPTTVNITNNINKVIYNNINNYNNTSLDKLTDKVYDKIIKDADEPYQIIPRLIKYIHCNPDIPENHNIRISNRNKHNKYLEVYRNNHWEIEDRKAEISNLINDKENLSDWIDEKGDKYPEALEKVNDYLEQKYDEEIANLIKEEVELLLYNNRHLIKS